MADFHQLKVADVHKETSDCSVVTFEVPDHLKENFKFTQGQHLTLRKILNGEDVRRPYSICSSPIDGQWRVAVKQIPGGLFSNYVNNELQVGDTLEVMEPTGSFYVDVHPNDTSKKNYIAPTAVDEQPSIPLVPLLQYTFTDGFISNRWKDLSGELLAT